MRKTPPKSLSFGSFTPAPANALAKNTLNREDFRGLPPHEAARRLVDFHASRVPMEEVTQAQKENVLTRILLDLAQKDLDLAAITPDHMAAYREWLRVLVECDGISESYAAHRTASWNATIRLAFGEDGKPGESLLMRGFPLRARQAQRLSEEEFLSLAGASHRRRFRSEDDREAFQTYLELEWSTGGRVGSFTPTGRDRRRNAPPLTPEQEVESWSKTATVGDIDWDQGTLRLRHMKNVDEHTAILTERALERLRQRVAYLQKQPYWKGDATALLAGKSGRPITPQAINRMLKDCLVAAGIKKHMTTHALRKNVGTHIAKKNPRFAHEQLGITAKIFEAHYNQPVLEDRLESRDILPGAVTAAPKTPDEMVGQAWLKYSQGRLSRADFEATVLQAEKLKAAPSTRVPETSAYG